MVHKFSLVAICLLVTGSAFAQDSYPAKPVTLILPFAPGGNDAETRLQAGKISELLGQTFLLDYKPGAGSTIGTAYVAKAPPDGYTLLVAAGAFSSLPALYKELSFHTVRDFAPVSLMSKRTTVLVVSPRFPAKSFQDYIAYARANPLKLNFGTSGSGATVHLSGAWLHSTTNTKVTFIHHKGTGPSLTELVAGRIDASAANMLTAAPLLKAGKLRVLAVMSDARSPLLPGMATIAEQGVPRFDFASWGGYLAPAGTPEAVVNRLSSAFSQVAKSPDLVSRMEAEGGEMVGSTPAEFRKLIVSETERWQKVVKENQIRIEL